MGAASRNRLKIWGCVSRLPLGLGWALRGLALRAQAGLAPLELLLPGHQRRLILGIVLLLQLGDGALALGGLSARTASASMSSTAVPKRASTVTLSSSTEVAPPITRNSRFSVLADGQRHSFTALAGSATPSASCRSSTPK